MAYMHTACKAVTACQATAKQEGERPVRLSLSIAINTPHYTRGLSEACLSVGKGPPVSQPAGCELLKRK